MNVALIFLIFLQIQAIREKVQGLELKAKKADEKAKRIEEGLPVDEDDEDDDHDVPRLSPEESAFQADVKVWHGVPYLLRLYITESFVQFMEFYQKFWPALIGIHAITLHCGSCRFRALCHGADVMEVVDNGPL